MTTQKIKLVIAGGGTAGWVTAATLSSQLGGLLDITLVESDAIGTLGVGEATIPTHVTFHKLLGIDERTFLRETKATFKLAIAFENWGALGDRYVHSFGQIGKSNWISDFHHMWRQAEAQGFGGDLGDYSYELQAAEAGRFYTGEKSPLSYAYHLDSSLYAQFLRKISEAKGVLRTEGTIERVGQDADSGDITALHLNGDRTVEGDLFIDCTGFRSLLMGETLGVVFDDWNKWLPMDRAYAVQTGRSATLPPYTRAIAQEAGWRWQIPLQHRVGNGHVYASDYMSDQTALDTLVGDLGDKNMVAEPKQIRFRTGRLSEVWAKNCIAVGLSGGFLEPLESTSIHLIQILATRLVKMFPFRRPYQALRRQFNDEFRAEFDSIRDFIILHYAATKRDDTAFWRDRQTLELPDSLMQRMALYRETGLVAQNGCDLFRVDSWHQVMRGQGLASDGYHRIGVMLEPDRLRAALTGLKAQIDQTVANLPTHRDFVAGYAGVDLS